ncbi:MAG TPA: 6-phosphogluconolactonase [Vicinamibacterales bacterium]|nr:6-phosphogluconolactonase [Vicinamibacterales bacterium]
MARLTVVENKAAMSEAAAARITTLIEAAIASRGMAAVSLTGGSTPDLLYQLLADPRRPWRQRIDWERLHLFWGDEREVPPDHPESNYGLAYRLLLQHVMIPDTQVHRMRGELPASDAGRLYDAVLRARRDQTAGPLFDVMLLGIGENAHIASIFPESPLLAGRPPERLLAAGVAVPELGTWRITMTPAALLDSAAIVMIAAEASKAAAVAAAIEGPLDVPRYPAQLLREAGERVEWIIDSAAAARLRAAPRA